MFKKLFPVLALAAGLSFSAAILPSITFAASPERHTFDPHLTCSEMLYDHAEKGIFWALGYRAHAQGAVSQISPDAYSLTFGEIRGACSAMPDAKFSVLVAQLYGALETGNLDDPEYASTTDDIATIKQSLIDMFEVPDLDLVALLREIRPELVDISAVFPKDMAQNLLQGYDEAFGSSLDGAELPSGQPIITVNFSTTFSLKESSLLADLRGAYERVLDLFLVDVPFAQVHIDYHIDGEPIDIDGFYYVNNHWVVMPDPWRGINQ